MTRWERLLLHIPSSLIVYDDDDQPAEVTLDNTTDIVVAIPEDTERYILWFSNDMDYPECRAAADLAAVRRFLANLHYYAPTVVDLDRGVKVPYTMVAQFEPYDDNVVC